MKIKALVMFVAMSVVLSVSAFAADEAKAPEPIKYGTAVGDNIQPVTLSTLDGSKKVDVAKLTNKTVFVLISSVCTACRKEAQEITENFDKIKDKADIYFVLIDMDAKSAASRLGDLPAPVLTDPDYKLGQAANLGSTPSTLIVQDGKITYTKFGYRSGQWKEFLQ